MNLQNRSEKTVVRHLRNQMCMASTPSSMDRTMDYGHEWRVHLDEAIEPIVSTVIRKIPPFGHASGLATTESFPGVSEQGHVTKETKRTALDTVDSHDLLN